MANRIYFANQQVAFKPNGGAADTWTAAHGVQSVAVTTTFNLEQAFELGQLTIYENIEGVPDIEITSSKVLDGYPLLYHLSTSSSQTTSPTLAGRSNASCLVALGIWPDTDNNADGAPSTQMEASGMFCSSIGYNFPLEDNFSEDITLVGNNKGWEVSTDNAGALGCTTPGWGFDTASGAFDGTDVPAATGAFTLPGDVAAVSVGGINRRENLAINATDAANAGGVDYTYLPTQIPGVSASGWPGANAHLQSITVSTDLGREELFELGTRQPYARIVTFPVEVTCDIECLSISGDQINAFADGCAGTDPCTGVQDNLVAEKIRIATCEGTRIYIGTQNKLASINYGGGDAGGGNVTITYSYSTFNDFNVLHPRDPHTDATGWWDDRGTYLGA